VRQYQEGNRGTDGLRRHTQGAGEQLQSSGIKRDVTIDVLTHGWLADAAHHRPQVAVRGWQARCLAGALPNFDASLQAPGIGLRFTFGFHLGYKVFQKKSPWPLFPQGLPPLATRRHRDKGHEFHTPHKNTRTYAFNPPLNLLNTPLFAQI